MNTQELRRLGVLPYEDAPRRRLRIRHRPWFTADGLQRVQVNEIEPQRRTLRAEWTMEPAQELHTFISPEALEALSEEITAEIDTSIVQEINEREIHSGIQPNPFDDDFEDMNPLQDESMSRMERALAWLRNLR